LGNTMSEHQCSNPAEQPGQQAAEDNSDITQYEAEAQGAAPTSPKDLPGLPAVIPVTLQAEPRPEPTSAPPGKLRPVLGLAAAVAVAGVVAGVTLLVVTDRHRQAELIDAHALETQTLVKAVDTINARLSAIENTKSHDELVDLHRSIGEMKTSVVSSRELTGAVAQISQRLERLDRDQSAKVDSLAARVDQETRSRAAELANRIEKLEKRAVVAAASADPRQPPGAPKFGSNVAMETTGSIARQRPVLSGYVVLGARDEVALIGDRYGERAVRLGDLLPGAGRVERIERRNGSWVVLTDRGLIGPVDRTSD
jgi:hypothetical protein